MTEIESPYISLREEGPKLRVEGIPTSWRALEGVLDLVANLGTGRAGRAEAERWSEAPESFDGPGTFRPIELSMAEQEVWVHYHDWNLDEEYDSEAHARGFLEYMLDGERLVMSRKFWQDVVFNIRHARSELQTRRNRKARVTRLLGWIRSLGSYDIDWREPSGACQEQLRALEATARALERRRLEIGPEDTRDLNGEQRRTLLIELHKFGIFDANAGPECRSLLKFLGLEELLSYREAADAMYEYLAKPARESFVLGPPQVPLLVAPISIDWFRLGPYTQGSLRPSDWLLWAEREGSDELVWSSKTREVLWWSGANSTSFTYRMDNPRRPCLVRCGRPVPGARASLTAAGS